MHERIMVVTRKGQVTIPIDIRQALNIQQGDKVAFSVLEVEGVILLQPVRSVVEMTYGGVAVLSPLPPEARRATFRELREQFEAGAAEEAIRS